MTSISIAQPSNSKAAQRKRLTIKWTGIAALVTLAALAIFVLLPLVEVVSRALADKDGNFVGISNFITYFQSPSLVNSLFNTLSIGLMVTFFVVTLAFSYAYALTHTRMPFKGFFRALAMLPIFAPSLLPAIALVYLFGNQGILKEWLFGASIYGPIGIVIGMTFWIFPHAFMIIYTALQQNDGRLYEAATSCKAGFWHTFYSVTLSNARYGLLSAVFVSFTLAVTDFGVAKVIGGQYDVLATDIYKQVIGQQNFAMGSVVGVVLLLPALFSFAADRWVQKKQQSTLNAKSTPFTPEKSWLTSGVALATTSLITITLLTIVGMAVYASFIKFWPYNLSFSLNNYQFDLMDGGGWESYFNSLKMATLTAMIGTVFIFVTAWLNERCQTNAIMRQAVDFLSMIPMAVPGMVLGLAYIFFFNQPNNPLNFMYGTLLILAVSSIAHFYTVCHLSFKTAFKQIDKEFDQVALSVNRSRWDMLVKLYIPLSMPAISSVFLYLFVNAMTTVSAVVFLYASDTALASVAVLNMDDAGDIAPAAAMATLIMVTCLAAKAVHWLIFDVLIIGRQTWRTAGA
ncbi:putative 2-aminoethylphosphonate ABC transporter permease subunit [Salinibius halmophilus]|uniref:putative 2-aminoethylphosphonate ABC transporter permease subunit n=1 Tax=Salinibius halmophilus TaxID=1853216 RepID=UPI000E669A80|nr:putative 2-aminoethylphosphonate ABC transporter permease subunit [Salinibius halmophilus]